MSRFGFLAVVAAVALLTTACDFVHVHVGSVSSSTGSANYRVNLAYAQCMRAHGLPDFPIPKSSGSSSFTGQLGGDPDSPAARANAACKHLLPGGSTGTGGSATPTATPSALGSVAARYVSA